MARSKNTILTTRERTCKRVARGRAWRKKVDAFIWGVRVAVIVGVVAFTGVLAVTDYGSARLVPWLQTSALKIYQATASSGLVLRNVYVEGRERTPKTMLMQALGVNAGDPMLEISVVEAQRRTEALPSVKKATIERQFPDALIVRIAERKPVAVWQYNEAFALVDDEGEIITGLDVQKYAYLPLIVGSDAPGHVQEVLSILRAKPELAGYVTSAVRVSNRRWNIALKDGLIVKLPTKNPMAAWNELARLQAKHHILDRYISAVDLRHRDRVFVTLKDTGSLPLQDLQEMKSI